MKRQITKEIARLTRVVITLTLPGPWRAFLLKCNLSMPAMLRSQHSNDLTQLISDNSIITINGFFSASNSSTHFLVSYIGNMISVGKWYFCFDWEKNNGFYSKKNPNTKREKIIEIEWSATPCDIVDIASPGFRVRFSTGFRAVNRRIWDTRVKLKTRWTKMR